MRCPHCQFVSADLHDLCPKCHLDLRPHKKLSGIAISDATSGYEELLRRAGVDPSAAPPATAAKPGFFSSLFRRPATEPESAPAPEPEPRRPSAAIQAPPPLVEPATPSVSASPPEVKSELSSEHLKAPPPQVEATMPPPSPAVPVAESARKVDRSPRSALPSAPLPESSIFRATPPVFDPVELDLAFDDAQAELRHRGDSGIVELTAESMLDLSKDKATVALFDLAFEVLEKPELEHLLTEKVTTSDERKVEAQDLKQELARIERKMSLPVFGLRSFQARAESARQAERAEPTRELKTATLLARFGAFLVDSLTVATLAVTGTFVLIFILDRRWLDTFNSRATTSHADWITWGSLVLAVASTMIVLYPLFTLLSGRRTLGQRIFRLRLVTELGRRVRLPHIMVRSLLQPLSLLCFGYLPALLGRRPLHDALARTKLCEDT